MKNIFEINHINLKRFSYYQLVLYLIWVPNFDQSKKLTLQNNQKLSKWLTSAKLLSPSSL
jgi:hypothetical protein